MPLAPLKRCGLGIVNLDELIDGLPDLLGGGEVSSFESTAAKDAEPHLDLIKPRGRGGGVMEFNPGMPLQPHIVFGLMGIEVV